MGINSIIKGFFVGISALIFQSCSETAVEPALSVTDFMNECMLEADSTNENIIINITPNVILHDESTISFLKELEDIISEKEATFIKSKIDTSSHTWDCNELNNVRCLNIETLDSIFSIPETVVETDTTYDVIKPWNVFRNLYGKGGINQYSHPLFNSKNNIAIIKYYGQYDDTMGVGVLICYVKENGKWVLYKKKTLYIS